jgi:hypothetical protein
MNSINFDSDSSRNFSFSKSTLIFINLGFFTALVLIKLFILPKSSVFKENAEHQILKKSIADNGSKIQKIQNKIQELPEKERQEKEKIQENFEGKIGKVSTVLDNNYQLLKNHQVAFNSSLSIGINLHEELSAMANKTVGIYIGETNAFRSDSVVLAITGEEKAVLTDPLGHYEYITDDEVETLFAKKINTNPNTNQKNTTYENNITLDFEEE